MTENTTHTTREAIQYWYDAATERRQEIARLRAVLARIGQMADHWERALPEVIRTPAVVSALRAALEPAAASAVRAPATDRTALSAKLWAIAEHRIVAEWICCEPLDPTHDLCAKGYAALEMTRSLIVDSPEAWKPNAPLLDAVLAVLPEPADRAAVLRETAQGYRGLVHDVEQPEIKTRYAQTADELDRLADDAQLAAPHLAAVLAECDTIEADYEGQHDEVGVGARAAILRIRTRATATDHTSESTAEEAPPAFEDDLQRAATVDPAVCPRCKGDNSEAFELCERCAPAVGGAQQPTEV